MSVRPLPHFAHKPIGKTTNAKGFSYQNINYITREDACSKTIAQNMPADRSGARPFFERMAYADGVAANARIADTLIIALPIEMTPEQRWEAISGFMEKIGKGRIAWLSAFHDMGKDEHNPHAHVIFRDADIETGRKVVGTTTSAKDVKEAEEKGWRVPPRMTTKDLRVAWCDHLNGEMQRHGHEARFDHRTLKQQGIDRQAGIHVGPKANSMAKKERDFESRDRDRGNHANIYSLIDSGSRAEHNERIAEENRRREADKRAAQSGLPHQPVLREGAEKRLLRERQAAERKAMYRDQATDRASLREAHDVQKLEHQRWSRELYAKARETARAEIKVRFDDRWQDNRRIADKQARQDAAEKLKKEQKAAYEVEATRQVDAVRPVKAERWENLKLAQDNERKGLQQRHLEEASEMSRQHIAERLSLHQTWTHQHLDKAAQRASAKLSAHQGMVPAQQTASSIVAAKTRAQQTRAGLPAEHAASPQLAAAHYSKIAQTAAGKRLNIRAQLDGARSLNQVRAAAPRTRGSRPGQMSSNLSVNRAALQAQRQARTADPQDAIRQAAASRRPLTDSERANASPETKAALTAERERNRREERFQRFVKEQNSGKGKDRDGGRSGR